MQTSRELFIKTLTFDNPERPPRDLWDLPWCQMNHPDKMNEIRGKYPTDLGHAIDVYNPSSKASGDPYLAGSSVDDWGVEFESICSGIIGEVKTPVIADLKDWDDTEPPYETLPLDNLQGARDTVNKFCAKSDKFTLMSRCARPWERYQFLRTTIEAMYDVMDQEKEFFKLINKIQSYYLKEMEFWASTDVDALFFMDDWGSQTQLLIPYEIWKQVFKPLYKEYCDMAKASNKFIFMHSDGFIEEIYPDLIEIGVSAVNSQLFCMDFDNLAEIAKGKITFWGEIDRQHILCDPNPEVARAAVRKVKEKLGGIGGGLIAQFELGPWSNLDVACHVYDEWEK